VADGCGYPLPLVISERSEKSAVSSPPADSGFLCAARCGMTRWEGVRWPIYNGRVKFKLREFRREDFDTLWQLDQQCFPAGISYSRFELAAYIKRSGSFTLVAAAEPGAEILGFIVAEANRRGVGHIITIDVRAAARRFGIASALLETAEDRLQSVKCTIVRLESAVDNTSALAFYKRHRYDVVKTLPRYYSTGVDAFVLEKDLLSPAPEVKLLR
jgi:ribosomal-protein-alanine N-acetyltransferase